MGIIIIGAIFVVAGLILLRLRNTHRNAKIDEDRGKAIARQLKELRKKRDE